MGTWAEAKQCRGGLSPLAGTPEVTWNKGTPTASMSSAPPGQEPPPPQGRRPSPQGPQTYWGQMHKAGNDKAVRKQQRTTWVRVLLPTEKE